MKYFWLLCVLLISFLLLCLSIWQINRFINKREINRSSSKNLSNTILLEEDIDKKKFQYKLVKITGKFILDKEIYIYRTFKSNNDNKKTLGNYMVLTLFENDNGQNFLVFRGFIEGSKANIEKVKNIITQNKSITLTGIAIPGEETPWFIKSFDDLNNIWFKVTLKEIQEFLKTDIVQSYYIVANPADLNLPETMLPVNFNEFITLMNNNYWHHMFYALNWFILSIAIIIIYWINTAKKNKYRIT